MFVHVLLYVTVTAVLQAMFTKKSWAFTRIEKRNSRSLESIVRLKSTINAGSLWCWEHWEESTLFNSMVSQKTNWWPRRYQSFSFLISKLKYMLQQNWHHSVIVVFTNWISLQLATPEDQQSVRPCWILAAM